LHHQSDASAVCQVAIRWNVLTIEPDLPALGLEQMRHNQKEGAFPRAIWTDDCQDLAALDYDPVNFQYYAFLAPHE
jgi:hypothetical protein